MASREIPALFADTVIPTLGDEGQPLLNALREGEPCKSVRLNRSKPTDAVTQGDGVGWCEAGRYVESDRGFTLDPLFHSGAYYVQEASSMFAGYAVKCVAGDEPVVLIDACAAPGGKTTAAIDSLPAGSLVIANEIVPARCAVLKENIVKWGYPSVIVTRGDTAALAKLGEVADIILADVPCSGEGMMRKDETAVAQWNPGLVESCAERQREIVSNLWQALCPGGFMIYSTCTFNRHENEENLAYIINQLGGEPVEIPVDEGWGIAPGIHTPYPCYRFLPHRLRGEGLFVAVVRKPGEPSSGHSDARRKDKRDRRKSVSQGPDRAVRDWVSAPDDMNFSLADDRINAFPTRWTDLLRRVESVTSVVHHGIPVATVKGRDLIPAHGLAMSARLASEAFPRVELSLPDALNYLRREAVVLPESAPRGYVVVTHSGLPLGFVKNLGSRSNNLYPPEYKIKFK